MNIFFLSYEVHTGLSIQMIHKHINKSLICRIFFSHDDCIYAVNIYGYVFLILYEVHTGLIILMIHIYIYNKSFISHVLFKI